MESKRFAKVKLIFEKTYPYIFGMLAAFFALQFKMSFPTGDGILSASLTIGAILTGFLATSKTLLLTLDTKIMIAIRQTPYGKCLISYMGQAIWLCFIFSVLAMFGYFVSTNTLWYSTLWVFVGFTAAFSFIRVTSITLRIISKSSET